LTDNGKPVIKAGTWRSSDEQNIFFDKQLVVVELHRRGLPAAIRT
jgi:hypothetical protein